MRRGKESKQIRLLLQFVNQFATSKSTWTYTTTLTPSELFVFTQKLKSICHAAKQKSWLAHLTLLGVIIIMRIVDIIIIYSIRFEFFSRFEHVEHVFLLPLKQLLLAPRFCNYFVWWYCNNLRGSQPTNFLDMLLS